LRILSNYIATTYLKILALCVGAFVSIYLVMDFLEKLRVLPMLMRRSSISGSFSSARFPG